jgi:serine/threonine protein kinase
MGRVLLAHDPVLGRDVAIKLLRDDLRIPQEQKSALFDRMRHEARASARVSHPNIVALFDMGEDPDAGLYLVFEHIVGTTLKERISHGTLGPEAVARLAREIGGALSTAHEAGVLHRDIKPENVMLTATGAKVADFGIARVPNSTLTRDGGLLGTPAYSAPEAIASGEFSPASDQFSMAATLWEALSGRRAFPGDDAVAVASKIALEEPPPIAEPCGLDPHVDAVLGRALTKSPRARFASCEEFGQALAEALAVSPRALMPTLPDQIHLEALRQRTETRTLRTAVGGAAIGGLLAIAGFQLTANLRRSPSQAEAATEASSHARANLPVGYLAERPSPRPRRPPPRGAVALASDVDAGGPPDAGRGSTDGGTGERPEPALAASTPTGAPP